MRVLTAIVFFTFGVLVSGCADDPPCEFPAQTESGIVCGVKKMAANGDAFISFLGIPYAKPPVGKLRYAEPQKPEPFNGIYNASRPGLVCPQILSEFGTRVEPQNMSEDCLKINVHIPLANLAGLDCAPKSLVPVFAYVHGGSFATGSGNSDVYGPEYLMTKGIALVTFNYRLNSIGFLSLGSKYIPGNAGLRDALFALKWVHRNIRNFGGDPDEVTLGGQSAGGAIASLLSVSPATKNQGYMKRVVALSGNALSSFFAPSPIAAKIFAELFLQGMNISSFLPSKTIHERLINAPIEDILTANMYVENKTGLFLTFGPVIENKYDGFTTILPKEPEYLVREGNGNDYTALLGFTNNECQVFRPRLINSDLTRTLQSLPVLSVPIGMLFASHLVTIPILTKKISNEYYNNTSPTLDKFLNLCTDSFYKYSALRLAEHRLADKCPKPTYIYEFGYDGQRSIFKTLTRLNWPGAAHSEDLTYFFRINAVLGPMVSNELDQPDLDSKMKEWMTTIISNFIKTGNPATGLDQWPQAGHKLFHQSIYAPTAYKHLPATAYMIDKKRFFDNLNRIGRIELF